MLRQLSSVDWPYRTVIPDLYREVVSWFALQQLHIQKPHLQPFTSRKPTESRFRFRQSPVLPVSFADQEALLSRLRQQSAWPLQFARGFVSATRSAAGQKACSPLLHSLTRSRARFLQHSVRCIETGTSGLRGIPSTRPGAKSANPLLSLTGANPASHLKRAICWPSPSAIRVSFHFHLGTLHSG